VQGGLRGTLRRVSSRLVGMSSKIRMKAGAGLREAED